MSSPYTPFPQGGSDWTPNTPQGYLQGGPVGFGEAASQAFKNLTNFNGRASRSAYWWFALVIGVPLVVLDIIAVSAHAPALEYLLSIIGALLGLAIQVRRLHDTDRSGFWWFIGLIPLIGGIVLLVFNCLPGTPGPNKFG